MSELDVTGQSGVLQAIRQEFPGISWESPRNPMSSPTGLNGSTVVVVPPDRQPIYTGGD